MSEYRQRAERLLEELRENREVLIGQVQQDVANRAVWCIARRPDGVRVVAVGYLR